MTRPCLAIAPPMSSAVQFSGYRALLALKDRVDHVRLLFYACFEMESVGRSRLTSS